MNKRLVIALGGNALGNTPIEQLKLVENTASTIVDLVSQGYEIVIGHGNGPQVGMVNLAFEYSHNNNGTTPLMPFPECGAMTQGYIGYHLQQAIQNELIKRNIKKDIVTIVTQVEVDESDEAFLNPTKPIGSFYSREEAEKINKETAYVFMEDAGRGYRRVVASPKPINIVELETIGNLLNNDTIVITVGGGGIPVIKRNGIYEGVAAVIDKDRACSKLAQDISADMLVILTAVDKVYLNYNQDNQKEINKMSITEAKKYIEEGHFAKGSMLPKVEACIEYIENMPNSKAIITSLDEAKEALIGNTGTVVYK